MQGKPGYEAYNLVGLAILYLMHIVGLAVSLQYRTIATHLGNKVRSKSSK